MAAPSYRMHVAMYITCTATPETHDLENFGANATNTPSIGHLSSRSPTLFVEPPCTASGLHSHNHVPSFIQVSLMASSKKLDRLSWLMPWTKSGAKMDNEQATFWLSQFIGKNLRIHASDGRVFGGQMKCTDKVNLLVPYAWHCGWPPFDIY